MATINPTDLLDPFLQHGINVEGASDGDGFAVKDSTGEAMVDGIAVRFVTEEGGGGGGGGAPTVVSTVPTDGATGVSTTANIKAKFSEAMKEKSINTNTFYLEADGAPCSTCVTTTTRVLATVRYNDDTKTAVLNPTDPLAPNTTYTATVEARETGTCRP